MPRAAKLEPFSRCRSETTSRLCSSQNSAPEMSAVSVNSAILTVELRAIWGLTEDCARAVTVYSIASLTSSSAASANNSSERQWRSEEHTSELQSHSFI